MSVNTNIEVVVYTKPACVQCDATKRWLTSKGIDWLEASAVTNVESIIGLLGFKSAPVIRVSDKRDHTVKFWSGHNPIELDKLLAI